MFLIILIISIETLTMRVLITVPTKSGYGGVTNYYLGIKEYWKENIEYFYFGRKPWRNIFYPFLIIRFIIRLICFKPDIVLLNPSLGDKALKRDFIYLNICRFFRKKTSVFIHGFNFEYAKNADWKWISANLNTHVLTEGRERRGTDRPRLDKRFRKEAQVFRFLRET